MPGEAKEIVQQLTALLCDPETEEHFHIFSEDGGPAWAQVQVGIMISPHGTGHGVKNHIMKEIQDEVLDEKGTKNPQSGVQARSGGTGG